MQQPFCWMTLHAIHIRQAKDYIHALASRQKEVSVMFITVEPLYSGHPWGTTGRYTGVAVLQGFGYYGSLYS